MTRVHWSMRLLQVEVDLKVNLSRDGTLMFKSCSKCKDNVLKDVLTTHERFCQGLTLRHVDIHQFIRAYASKRCNSYKRSRADSPRLLAIPRKGFSATKLLDTYWIILKGCTHRRSSLSDKHKIALLFEISEKFGAGNELTNVKAE